MDSQSLVALFGNKAIMSLMIIYLMNWLKGSKLFPWFTFETQRLNHLLAILLTGFASLGIHFVWDSHAHSLMIQGLMWSTILPALWHWVQQYVLTKAGYHLLQDKLPGGSKKAS